MAAILQDRRFAQIKVDELNTLLVEKDQMVTDLRHRLRIKNEELERLRNDKLQVCLITVLLSFKIFSYLSYFLDLFCGHW